MSTIPQILKDCRTSMDKGLDVVKREFASVRSGKASPSMLDTVRVEMYGQQMMLNQVASIAAPEPRTILVTPFDKGQVKVVEKAIRESDLGLNPAAQGDLLRVPMPPLTEERRKDLTKVVHGEGEDAKVAIRNIRRDANHQVKELLKDKQITEDDSARTEAEIQKITDSAIKDVDDVVKAKEAELMSV
jgi:ribosome recycling factor